MPNVPYMFRTPEAARKDALEFVQRMRGFTVGDTVKFTAEAVEFFNRPAITKWHKPPRPEVTADVRGVVEDVVIGFSCVRVRFADERLNEGDLGWAIDWLERA